MQIMRGVLVSVSNCIVGWASGRILGTASNVKIKKKTCGVKLETEFGNGSLKGIKAI